MKKLIAICLLLLAFALPVAGQSKPKPWYKSKQFWAETAVVATFAALDAESTQRGFQRCPTCYERLPVFGVQRPGRARMYLIGGALVAAERGTFAALWKHDSAREISFVATLGQAGYHAAMIAHNNRLCPANGTGCR